MRRILILAMSAPITLTGGAVAQTMKIGVTGPFTGPSLSMGVSLRDGAKLAVSEINRSGGIMGQQVVLVERDDEGDIEHGTRIARDLTESEHVVATVGYANTDVALAAQPIYEAAKVPVLNAVAAGTLISHQFSPPEYKANYIFRTSTSDAIQAALIVQEAIARRGFKAPAILTDSGQEARQVRSYFMNALEALHVTAAANETFHAGDTDMTAQLSRLRQANADVLLVYGPGDELARVANGMGQLGWKLPMIGGESLATATFMYNARFNGEDASMPQTFIQVGNTEKRAAFIAAYQIAYLVTRIPCPDAAAQAYDSVWLLKVAIEQAKSTDGDKIREALESLRTKVEGVVTTYDHPFSPSDHEAITRNMPLFGVVRNGHVVVAHEPDTSGWRAMRVKQ
jgi:branched-chain amino acid transport system substrate-binding protein